MSNWSYNNPPPFKNPKGNDLVATSHGWEDPDTGELIVAINGLATKAGAADVISIAFDSVFLSTGQAIIVRVRYNERVDVTAGAKITLNWTGGGSTVDLYALAQTNKNIIVFNKASNLTDSVSSVVDRNITIAAQTINGTIKDAGTMTASNKAISAGQATDAGTCVVNVPATISSISFVDTALDRGYAINAAVTFSKAVDVSAGAKINLTWSGSSGDFFAFAENATNVTVVHFTLQENLEDNIVIPNEAGSLSVSAQTLVGTIKNHATSVSATKTVSGGVASAVSPIVVNAAAIITDLAFDEVAYERNDAFSVTATYSEAVDVTDGVSILVNWTGSVGPMRLYALEQTNTTTVVFDKALDLTNPKTIPSMQGGTLSIMAQSLQLGEGTIKDHGKTSNSSLVISSDAAATSTPIVVTAPASIISVDFNTDNYERTDIVSVTVTFSEEVDLLGAMARLRVNWTGASGDFNLYALPDQTETTTLVFDKKSDGTTDQVIPDEPGTFNIDAQSLILLSSGHLYDFDTTADSFKSISGNVADATGSFEVS